MVRQVLTFLSFVGVAESFFVFGGGGLKLEINIPLQRIRAKWKGGLINEGGVISSEYGILKLVRFKKDMIAWCLTHRSKYHLSHCR